MYQDQQSLKQNSYAANKFPWHWNYILYSLQVDIIMNHNPRHGLYCTQCLLAFYRRNYFIVVPFSLDLRTTVSFIPEPPELIIPSKECPCIEDLL